MIQLEKNCNWNSKPDTYFHTGKGSHLHMITTPNKFLRIHKDGFVLYSMRLTIKSLCPMDLHSFPMDKQSCPLILGSYGYPNDQLLYQWDVQPVTLYNKDSNSLSQFDIFKTISRNKTFVFKRGNYSMLQVNFNLRRHVGYFLIQIYVPCSLIVVLSWVSFWINREATADRVGLGVTAVLTLSTFGLDSRSDLPRVSYATALDWYTIMCFLFVVFTLLEFAGVHYFTKVGTGEVPIIEIDDNWSRSSEEEESTPSEDRLPVVATRHRPTHRMERSVTNTRYRRSCKSFARKKLRHRLTGNHRKTFQISHQYEMQYPANSFNANQHFQHVDQRSKLRPWNCKTLNHSRDASFHMPYCPHSPEYQEYLGWEPAVSKNALAPSGCDDFSRMSYLENYLAKRLKNSSNMSLVYPAHNQNNFSSFDESSLKLNSSWPTLAWAKLPAWHSDRSKWLSEAESDDLEAVEKNGEECSEESGASQMWLMWRRLLHDLSQCCIQFWYCFTVNEQYKQEMKRRRTKGIAAVNSVSRIDKVSRIFFPFVFLVLNLFYWTFYINERNTDFNQWE